MFMCHYCVTIASLCVTPKMAYLLVLLEIVTQVTFLLNLSFTLTFDENIGSYNT